MLFNPCCTRFLSARQFKSVAVGQQIQISLKNKSQSTMDFIALDIIGGCLGGDEGEVGGV